MVDMCCGKTDVREQRQVEKSRSKELKKAKKDAALAAKYQNTAG